MGPHTMQLNLRRKRNQTQTQTKKRKQTLKSKLIIIIFIYSTCSLSSLRLFGRLFFFPFTILFHTKQPRTNHRNALILNNFHSWVTLVQPTDRRYFLVKIWCVYVCVCARSETICVLASSLIMVSTYVYMLASIATGSHTSFDTYFGFSIKFNLIECVSPVQFGIYTQHTILGIIENLWEPNDI